MSEEMNAVELKTWPDLKGKTGAEAEKYLKENHPDLEVIKLLENSPMKMDLRRTRVRVIVDTNDKVVAAPMTG